MANMSSTSDWKRLGEMTLSYGGVNEFKILFTRSNIDDTHLIKRSNKHSDDDSDKECDKVMPLSNLTKDQTMEAIQKMGFKFHKEETENKRKIARLDFKINSKHGESLKMRIKSNRFNELSSENNKYWMMRHTLFTKFDSGIQLDQESWYSVTPELLARHIASRLKCNTIIDAFCGAGGNAIQFAMVCDKVIAIDIDPKKIKMARHNARIYGVEHKIVFINKNFLEFVVDSRSRADVVFLSPPWGGPSYRNKDTFSMKAITPDMDSIMEKAKSITNNIAVFLPRNTSVEELIKYSQGNPFEVEQNAMTGKLKTVTAYYGNTINTTTDPISTNQYSDNKSVKDECSWRIHHKTDHLNKTSSRWNEGQSCDEKLSLRPMAYRNFNNHTGPEVDIRQEWRKPKQDDIFKVTMESSLEEKLSRGPRQYKNFTMRSRNNFNCSWRTALVHG